MVYGACVSEGPWSFHVHLDSQEEMLTAMMTDLNAQKLKPLRGRPKPGLKYAGRFNEDSALCRAVVLATEANRCQVQFIDYGTIEFVPYSTLHELPERYKIIKPLSVKCKLNGSIELPENAVSFQLFIQLVTGKLLKMVIVEEEKGEKGTMHIVEMYDAGENILEMMKQKLGIVLTKYSTLKLQPNSTHQVIVSYVETEKLPWSFHIQLLDQGIHLDRLMSELSKYCSSIDVSPDIKLCTPDFPIFALCQLDQQWYRAQVLDSYEASMKVQFVDYGNVDEVLATETREAKVELVRTLPAQAVLCRLQSADTVQDAAVEFAEMASSKSFEMKVVQQLETGEMLVRLFDISMSPTKDIGYDLMVKKQNLQAVSLPPTHPYPHQLSVPVPGGSLPPSRPASRASIIVEKEKGEASSHKTHKYNDHTTHV